jgi:hypothetical protein
MKTGVAVSPAAMLDISVGDAYASLCEYTFV